MKKLDLNFYALEFTENKYQALAKINETFYNDSYKKSAFYGPSFDEVIVTHGSTDLRFLEVLKILSEAYADHECTFKYGNTTYISKKGVVSQTKPEEIILI